MSFITLEAVVVKKRGAMEGVIISV